LLFLNKLSLHHFHFFRFRLSFLSFSLSSKNVLKIMKTYIM
jgi:hypothetical protein